MNATTIQWRKARVVRTDLTVSKHYVDQYGDWELVEVQWLHPDGYGHYWLCIKHFGARGMSQHRTRQAAEAATTRLYPGAETPRPPP